MAKERDKAAPALGQLEQDPNLISLMRMLYVSEVYSAETVAVSLETYSGLEPSHRKKLEASRRLYLSLARQMLAHMNDDMGLGVRPPTRARRTALGLATLTHASWHDRMLDLEGGSIRGVYGFRVLRSMYGDNPPEHASFWMAHEMAMRDFARDELDGESEHSLTRILALLDDHDRAAIAVMPG